MIVHYYLESDVSQMIFEIKILDTLYPLVS